MALDFPTSPGTNDIYTSGTRSWIWNGTVWNAYENVPTISASDDAPANPVANQMWYESDTGKTYIRYDNFWVEIGTAGDMVAADALSGTTLASNILWSAGLRGGRRNRIINGTFDVWQRGAGAFTTANSYTADMFKVSSFGSTFSASRQGFTFGNPIAGYESPGYMRIAVTSSAGVNNYVHTNQHIESVVRTFAGQQCTLSFWIKADAACNAGLEFVQNFGTGGSPSAEVNGISSQLVAVTTSWVRKSITISVPSISGKTLGSDNNDFFSVRLWLDCGSTYAARSASVGQQSRTFDFWGFQLEPGPVASPLEQVSFGEQLALCQRYYRRLVAQTSGGNNYQTFGWGFANGTTVAKILIPHPTPPRIHPAFSSSGAFRLHWGGSAAAVTSFTTTTGEGSSEAYMLEANVASGLTTKDMVFLQASADGTAYIQLSAEL